MWPYTDDESAWVSNESFAVYQSRFKELTPMTIFEIEAEARRYRAEVIGGMLVAAGAGLWRLLKRLGGAVRTPRGETGTDGAIPRAS
jgi:hypothetical protein